VFQNGQYFDHISIYCSYLDAARKQFKAGKDKAAVLVDLIELHVPKNIAESMAKVSIASSVGSPALSPVDLQD